MRVYTVRASYVRIVPIVFFLLRKWPRRMTCVNTSAHAFSKSARAINLLLLIPTSWRGSFYFTAKTRHKSVPCPGNENELYHCFPSYTHTIYKDLYCTFGREKKRIIKIQTYQTQQYLPSLLLKSHVSIWPTSNFRQRTLFISRDSQKNVLLLSSFLFII